MLGRTALIVSRKDVLNSGDEHVKLKNKHIKKEVIDIDEIPSLILNTIFNEDEEIDRYVKEKFGE